MDEQALRGLIADVKDGKLSRRAFVAADDGARPDRADGEPDARLSAAWRRRRAKSDYKPTKRGGGGALKVLWWQGADAAQPALRRRHQGPGRLAHLLRAARRLGRRRQPGAGARRRDPEPRERRARRGRQVGHLEAQAGRATGTTASRSPPTTSSSTGNTPRDPATAAVTIGSYKDVKVEKVDDYTVTRRSSTSRRRSGPTPSSARAA